MGKSRLAVEVAQRLPEQWMSGRYVSGQAAELLPAVLACAQPTLVVVDDADTEPDVATLIEQLSTRDDQNQVKVLLLVRDAAVFEHWVRQRLPDAHRAGLPTTTLAVVGAAGDRRRWFVEATQAYAAALGLAPPPVSDVDTRPVGTEGEVMVITQARAVLSALTGSPELVGSPERVEALRSAGIDQVAAELIEHERQRWDRAAQDRRRGLPDSFTSEGLQEALLALVLRAPATPAEAVAVLRRLPRFRDQTDENVLRNIGAWAHHLYPGPGPAQVEPSPDFLRGALLATLTTPAQTELLATLTTPAQTELLATLTTPAQTELTDAVLSGLSPQQASGVLTRLIRAASLFGTVAPLVDKVLHDQLDVLSTAIETLVLTGLAAKPIERHFLLALTPTAVSTEDINHLLALLEPSPFTQLRTALHELAVHHARDARDNNDTDDTRAALAASLHNLGVSLRELGRYREALTANEEALGLWRDLAAQEPARHTPDLANSLHNLGVSLGELGRYREALAAHEEEVGLRRDLAAQEPARHTPDLANSLHNLGVSLRELGRYRKALAADEEAVGLRRDLAAQEPARHTPALAASLHSLGVSLWELGRHREALAADEEALGLRRDLAAQEPARHPDLANSLHGLGISLRDLGRHREALTANEEAVGLRRDLAAQEPARHNPALANSLTNLAEMLCQLGRHDEELELRAETTVRWQTMAQLDLKQHDDAYQRARNQLAGSFSQHGHDPGAAWRAERTPHTDSPRL